jgi:uncharacterized membrane protein
MSATAQSSRSGRETDEDRDSSHSVNVGNTERTASVAAGALLLGIGLSRWSITALVLTALGGGLLYRGVTGHCSCYDAMGIDTACQGRTGRQ